MWEPIVGTTNYIERKDQVTSTDYRSKKTKKQAIVFGLESCVLILVS